MNKKLRIILLVLLSSAFTYAQPPSPSQIQGRLPKGTNIHGNIHYNKDTPKKHLLDIYLPTNANGKVPSDGVPLIVFIHGGNFA